MDKSITDHLWKIHDAEIELSKCRKGTPHYNDLKKYIKRLNKELAICKRYLDQTKTKETEVAL